MYGNAGNIFQIWIPDGHNRLFRPDFWGLLKETKYLRHTTTIEMARDAITDDNEQGAKKGRDKAGISFRPLTSLQNHYMQPSEAAFRYHKWKIVHETKIKMFSFWCFAAHPYAKDLTWIWGGILCEKQLAFIVSQEFCEDYSLIWARLQDQIKNSCLLLFAE